MENPIDEVKDVVRALTQGSAEEQHDAIYRYFAPGAEFEHPFCRVPSFKNVHVPGLGGFESRAVIAAIFKWYKILSPKIDLEIESCVMDEQANLIYLKIFQIFSIWFIPFYRAPVHLVTVLHLSPSTEPVNGHPPPPYDAAQDKLHAVQEGAEPSYAAVASGEASASEGQQQQQQQGDKSPSSRGSGPKRYLIQKQEDLYQVNEFLKFVTLSPGSAVAGFLQLFATIFCVIGAAMLGPVMKAILPATSAKTKQR